MALITSEVLASMWSVTLVSTGEDRVRLRTWPSACGWWWFWGGWFGRPTWFPCLMGLFRASESQILYLEKWIVWFDSHYCITIPIYCITIPIYCCVEQVTAFYYLKIILHVCYLLKYYFLLFLINRWLHKKIKIFYYKKINTSRQLCVPSMTKNCLQQIRYKPK
jgi:hypothetical protein